MREFEGPTEMEMKQLLEYLSERRLSNKNEVLNEQTFLPLSDRLLLKLFGLELESSSYINTLQYEVGDVKFSDTFYDLNVKYCILYLFKYDFNQ